MGVTELFKPDSELRKHLPFGHYIDAGSQFIRHLYVHDDSEYTYREFPVQELSSQECLLALKAASESNPRVYISGNFAQLVQKYLGFGEVFPAAGVMWLAVRDLAGSGATAILDLSSSGYATVGLREHAGKDGCLLRTNPHCGSGTGMNLDRVLRKLDIARTDVDRVLADFSGSEGSSARAQIPVRADRCGVFASSATISDKNQGIPLDFALATTLKSEVLKGCKQITSGFDKVYLTGGVFKWEYARDCAADYLKSIGIPAVEYIDSAEVAFRGLKTLACQHATSSCIPSQSDLNTQPTHPGFSSLQQALNRKRFYARKAGDDDTGFDLEGLNAAPLLIGIDVGSTMAKLVVSHASTQAILYRCVYSNSGDTVTTIKRIFQSISAGGVQNLDVVRIGITGSARYQIQKALIAVYPRLADRVMVMVENYAHAYGSLDIARDYIHTLQEQGISEINSDFCLLVDVGGEDTKISCIDLHTGELYDNAMNTKCSAGTGSLLDTLVDLFDLPDVESMVAEAYAAPHALALNATCAVFLLENVRKLQAAGVARDVILASAVWTVVENMARSLWPMIYLPQNSVVLLHGQTMQSDPMPLAVTERLKKHTGGAHYSLVPAYPGYRACIGLIENMADTCGEALKPVPISLSSLIDKSFKREIVSCKGGVCGDKHAHCFRTKLSSVDGEGLPFSIFLGGCAAVNELPDRQQSKASKVEDGYRDIWNFQLQRLAHSDAKRRLVIPRSFAVSEWAPFFSALFAPYNIPVHVDTPQKEDILKGQGHFRIDTCAPHIGVVGQFLRLAQADHGIILAPQIEFLPGSGKALGRTCTINQGGFAVAKGIAESVHPESRIHLFNINLKEGNRTLLASKLFSRLQPVYAYYGIDLEFDQFEATLKEALIAQRRFKNQLANHATTTINRALRNKHRIALVMGREYILNPGVYDSHVGRLLRDKGLVGIPSYALNATCAPALEHLYWRNAHLMASLADAVSRRKLHTLITHPKLKEAVKQCESDAELLATVQVSTFLCGPDSVTSPLVDELVKNRPFLRIQADAAIQELAHLENRMNTYVKQLAAARSHTVRLTPDDSFDVRILDGLENDTVPDPATDVICIPTLSDNRALLAVLRSAGYICLDNYSEDYALQTLVEQGRSVVGDSVCTPMAAVYGDVIRGIDQFQRLRQRDNKFKDKKRLLIFNNKGLGPCRQGQYVEAHKLFLFRGGNSKSHDSDEIADNPVRFLVAHENQGFRAGFPGWIFLRGIQTTILQGVLHQMLAQGSARCNSKQDYELFSRDFKILKDELYKRLEQYSAPTHHAVNVANRLRHVPLVYPVALFFCWGFQRNFLKGALKDFSKKWGLRQVNPKPIRIHIDGEAYMRTAQFEALHAALVAQLGPGSFTLTYTPLWGFLEYKLAGMLMRAKEGMKESLADIRRGGEAEYVKKRRGFFWRKLKRYISVSSTCFLLRSFLAAPLYRNAAVSMPERLTTVLKRARRIVSTARPGGELIPYIGEAALKLDKGYDLVLNVAPEGCMVSSMGEALTEAIYASVPGAKGRIQPIFSQQGDVDHDQLNEALLQALGPERLYGIKCQSQTDKR